MLMCTQIEIQLRASLLYHDASPVKNGNLAWRFCWRSCTDRSHLVQVLTAVSPAFAAYAKHNPDRTRSTISPTSWSVWRFNLEEHRSRVVTGHLRPSITRIHTITVSGFSSVDIQVYRDCHCTVGARFREQFAVFRNLRLVHGHCSPKPAIYTRRPISQRSTIAISQWLRRDRHKSPETVGQTAASSHFRRRYLRRHTPAFKRVTRYIARRNRHRDCTAPAPLDSIPVDGKSIPSDLWFALKRECDNTLAALM